MRALLACGLLVALGCASERPRSDAPLASAKPSAEVAAVVSAPPAIASAVPVAEPPAAPDDRITPERALALLYPDTASDAARACLAGPAPIECLLGARYAEDERALAAAVALYLETGTIAGLERSQRIDGGWRGEIELVPEPPIGKHRRHLDWVLAAERDFVEFFALLGKDATSAPRYRWRPIELKFFRSVGRTTPSAYAHGWSIAYNVSGSLNGSETSVRETLFHEVFHLNDAAHGNWSEVALGSIYERVTDRCTRAGVLGTGCLTPFTPNHTMVRGGTYYAFQPGNGVAEYAAELALRYYREQRAVQQGHPPVLVFKCGPPENGEAWRLMVDEFFGGIDRVPACK